MGEDPEPLDERPPEQPRHAEWKSWYRHKALGSLMAKKDYFFESIDKSLNDLNDPDRQEAAAVALFWSVYLADGEPMRLAGDKVREIDKWLDQEVSKESKEEERRLAFVKLHLAGTLAISLIRPGVKLAEAPLAVKALEKAVEIGPRFANIEFDNKEYWGRRQLDRDVFALSTVLVAGIAQLELALRWEDEEQYQKAFLLMEEATRRLCLASFWSYDPLHRHSLPRAFEYLPHSWDELDPEDAVRIFNKLRSDPDQVREGWGGVRNACKYFDDLYQYDWSVPSVTDYGGERLPPERYWERAAAFAEEQMTTHELRRALREGEAERVEETLRRDFPVRHLGTACT